jgi:transposase
VNCGFQGNADLVAANNILAAGLAVSACGESVLSGHSMKQEPSEGLRRSSYRNPLPSGRGGCQVQTLEIG